RVVIMYEPATVLAGHELERLVAMIAALKAQGVAIIYISHRLEEVFRIADRATVLRDGQVMATLNPAETTRTALIRLMVGREVQESERGDGRSSEREPILEVHGLCAEGFLRDISFTLHRGEILGVAGLVGAGRTTLARAIAGADLPAQGHVLLEGRRLRVRAPSDAIRAGIGLVPEDRKRHGFVPGQSVAANLALP